MISLPKLANADPFYKYTLEHYYTFFIYLVRADFNARLAAENYKRNFPDLPRHPDYRVFHKTGERLRETGSLLPSLTKGGRHPSQIPLELQQLIVAQFKEDPNLSVRAAATRLGTNGATIRKALVRLGFKNTDSGWVMSA